MGKSVLEPRLSDALTDGDSGWIGVDSRGEASGIPAGYASGATNIGFSNRIAGLRPACNRPAWGFPLWGVTSGSASMLATQSLGGFCGVVTDNLPLPKAFSTGGVTYSWVSTQISAGALFPDTGAHVVSGTVLSETQSFWETSVCPFLASIQAVNYTHVGVSPALARPVALARFDDPDGIDGLVLVTPEARADGGCGRVYRIVGNNAPSEVSMNGHDVWGACRLIQCYNGLVLLRHGPGRHYFKASDVNTGTSEITLHVTPEFPFGSRVVLYANAGSSIDGVMTSTRYYAHVSGAKVKLYQDAALTTLRTLSAPVGTFYLERDDVSPGPNGIGALPLLMQRGDPTVKPTPWDAGFVTRPNHAVIISADPATDTIVAPEHRLLVGDGVTVSGGSLPAGLTAGTTYYARPQNDYSVTLHATLADALAGVSPVNITGSGTGNVIKVGASALSMPPGREGIYYKNRLVLVSGRDQAAVSDVLDVLHYAPYQSSARINQGEADEVIAVAAMSEDAVLLLKRNSVHALIGLKGPATVWEMREVTREYGCIAPLSVVQVGKDVWFLSARGVVSLSMTQTGLVHGVAQPVSAPVDDVIQRIDWRHADKSCAAWFENRYLLAVPLQGQDVDQGDVVNNGLISFNFLNQAWEGSWTGPWMRPVQFARHTVSGQELLCYADAAGTVNYLDSDWFDRGFTSDSAIQSSLVTRGYSAGRLERKRFCKVEVAMESFAPTYTILANLDGESADVALVSDRTKDRTRYYTYGKPAYDATNVNGDFLAPGREDYSWPPGFAMYIQQGAPAGMHQTVSERYYFRRNARHVQCVLSSRSGDVRWHAVKVNALPGKRGGNVDK